MRERKISSHIGIVEERNLDNNLKLCLFGWIINVQYDWVLMEKLRSTMGALKMPGGASENNLNSNHNHSSLGTMMLSAVPIIVLVVLVAIAVLDKRRQRPKSRSVQRSRSRSRSKVTLDFGLLWSTICGVFKWNRDKDTIACVEQQVQQQPAKKYRKCKKH